MAVVIYSNDGCPRCEVIKKKLEAKRILFTEVYDFDREKFSAMGFSTLPVVEIDGDFMDFSAANEWINQR